MFDMDLRTFTLNRFSLMVHHGIDMFYYENMIPWEAEIFVSLLADYVKEENDRIRMQNQGNG